MTLTQIISAGDRFNFLVATGQRGHDRQGRAALEFRCDCGTTVMSDAWYVRAGKRQSCGCRWRIFAAQNRTRHGHARAGKQTAEYRCWASMKRRCLDPKDKSYGRYGGRGIAVCAAWLNSFPTFLADMGAKPSARHSIDRIDVDGPYAPWNCRWADSADQARNKRNTRFITIDGKRVPLADACERAGVAYKKAHDRLQNGWDVGEALKP